MRYGAAIILLMTSISAASPRDSILTNDLIEKGRKLSPEVAAKLERRLEKKPADEQARIQVLAYYTQARTAAARLPHILWLIDNDPQEGLGLYSTWTEVYRVNCEGDDLADRAGFEQVRKGWLGQTSRNPADAAVRENAVRALRYCAPADAERLLLAAKDDEGLGRLYAESVLGITGQDYWTTDPTGSTAARRASEFGMKAKQALDSAERRGLVVAAASTLLNRGATLWADEKLDEDYRELGNRLLAKAKLADPENVRLYALPTELPKRGERPPAVLRIGGNVQAAQLISQVKPEYPSEARRAGVVGTVRMSMLVGLDGSVLRLGLVSGPPELVRASKEAVTQWKYKVTRLNGRPCYVVTLVDVRFARN